MTDPRYRTTVDATALFRSTCQMHRAYFTTPKYFSLPPTATRRLHASQEYPIAALEDDCKLLESLLDDCLRMEIGKEQFHDVSAAAPPPPCPLTHSLLLGGAPTWLGFIDVDACSKE